MISTVLLAVTAVSPSAPSVADIAAQMSAVRTLMPTFAVKARIALSAGHTTDVHFAKNADAVRWGLRTTSPSGEVCEDLDVMIRGTEGVRVQAANGLAMRADAGHVNFGEVPAIRYLGYARWYPFGNSAASLEHLLPTLTASVRTQMESVEGLSCWVVDTFAEDGALDDTYWIAPSRAWMPVRWVNWNDGAVLDDMRVTAWHDLGDGKYLPAAGRTDHMDGGAWGELSIAPLAEGELAATLTPTEADLPADPTSIVPAGLEIWDRPVASVSSTTVSPEASALVAAAPR